MNKKYILLTKTESKYEGFCRYHFKLFENYFELQKHLVKFWYMNNNDYVVFEESNIKEDKSLFNQKINSLFR